MKYLFFLIAVLSTSCATTNMPQKAKNAHALAQSGNFAAALELYTEYLCQKPNDLLIATSYVQTWHQLGADTQSDTLKACLLDTQTLLYMDALKDAAQQDYLTALTQLEQLKPSDESEYNAELFYRQGLIAIQIDNVHMAHALLKKAHTQNPKRIDILLAYSQSLLDTKNIQLAQKHLHAILKLNPSHAEIMLAAQIHNTLIKSSHPALPEEIEQEVQEALRKIESEQLTREIVHQILNLSKSFPYAKVFLAAGLASLRYGLEQQGVALLKKAEEKNRFDPHPCHALAFYFEANKQLTESLRHYEKAFVRDPYNIDYARKVAEKAEKVGDLNLAISALKNLQNLSPQQDTHLFSLARIYRKKNNYISAQKFIEQAHKIAPKNIPIVIEWVIIALDAAQNSMLKAQDRKRAQKNARKALDALKAISPNHPAGKLFSEKLELLEQAT